jgi:hypothetical protein
VWRYFEVSKGFMGVAEIPSIGPSRRLSNPSKLGSSKHGDIGLVESPPEAREF